MAGKRKPIVAPHTPASEIEIPAGTHVIEVTPDMLPKTEAPDALWGTTVNVREDDPKGQEKEALIALVIAARRHSWTMAKTVHTIGRGIYFVKMSPQKEVAS